MAALVLTDLQKVSLSLLITNAVGNPAPVDGPPTWTLSVPGVVSLVVAPDGMSAVATSIAAGLTRLTVSADADLSSGVKQISTFLDIQVVASEAVSIIIVAASPEPK